MGTYRIRMPQLGETVDEGTLTEWHKQPGDEIAAREAIADIETDKVNTELESPVAGTLQRLLVEPGETIAVGAVLAELEVEGEVEDDAGSAEEPAKAPAEEVSARASGNFAAADLKLSPRVRRMVDEHEIDLEALAAFVDQPRVDRNRVEAYLAQRSTTPASQDGSRLVPFGRVRALVGERMRESLSVAPHVASAMEVDFEAVAAARREARELTWLSFVSVAVADVLRAHERLNASVEPDGLRIHDEVNLGVTVDLDGEGLMVPVLRKADTLSLVEIARAIREVATAAREGRLAPDDIQGATFTITSQGPSGTLFTTPIIQQPQVAILSVDGIRRRPVIVEPDNGDEARIDIRHTGVLTLSWDHRAIDGTYAAGFLAAVRDRIASTDWLAALRAAP